MKIWTTFIIVLLALSLVGCADDSSSDSDQDDDATDDDMADDDDAADDDVADDDVADDDVADDDTSPDDCSVPLYEQITSLTLDLPDSGDPTDVYFPADAAAVDLPLALLLQGALVDKQYYASFAGQVAGYGFVVAVPNHRRTGLLAGLYPDLRTIGEALAFFTAADVDPESPLFGRVDENTLLLLGHSFGGAAALYAIQDKCMFPFCTGGFSRPAELKAAALYAAHLTTAGVAPPIQNGDIAVALTSGSVDGVATPDEMDASYVALQAPPKALITALGANHFGICDINNPPGADPDASPPTLPQEVANETLARWSALFLRAHALDDACAYDYIHGDGATTDANVEITAEP